MDGRQIAIEDIGDVCRAMAQRKHTRERCDGRRYATWLGHAGEYGTEALVVAVVLGVCALTLVEVGTAIRIRR